MKPVFLHQFKTTPDAFVGELKAAVTFQSSGTTGEQRSKVHFSKKGLEDYKERCLNTIDWVLSHRPANSLAGESKNGPGTLYSFIPSIEEWKTSSLAQMIHWFGEKYGIEYVTNASQLPQEEPIWVFGTALHYAGVMDEEQSRALHPDSILLETGGFKGQRSAVSKSELYQSIQTFFKLEPVNIVSEYGSCELSAQAYDSAFIAGNDQKKFFFHPDVKLQILDQNGDMQPEGVGSLVVCDPLRSDLFERIGGRTGEQAIVTEDLVELAADGSFALLGRVNEKKLRGCSLFAEADQKKKSTSTSPDENSPTLSLQSKNDIDLTSANKRLSRLRDFISSEKLQKEFEEVLTTEISSHSAAKSAFDLFLSKPLHKMPSQLSHIYLNAFGGRSPKRWDIILPGNHSVAGWQPLILGFLFGKEMTVHLPPVKAVRDSAAFFIKKILNQCGAKISALNEDWQPQDVDSSRGVLVFGRDETIAWFRSHVASVAGHGSHIAGVRCESLSDFPFDAFIAEHFSLGQTGCLETRFLVIDQKPSDAFITKLHDAFLKFWGQSLNAYQMQALIHEQSRIKHASCRNSDQAVFYSRPGSLLPVFLPSAENLTSILADTPFCLPIITSSTFENLSDASGASISMQSPFGPDVTFNGTHQGKGLFK